MLPRNNPYTGKIPELKEMQEVTGEEVTRQLENYLKSYKGSFIRSQQVKYFEAFEKGLLSNLARKSIEPTALSFLGEKEVRGMQQFFTRSRGWDERLRACYQKKLSGVLNETNGFLSVDESDFVKKGKESAGVARQYCGRLGKRENCQAGVFLSYATEKGIGLADSRLYIPQSWFEDEYAQRREDCDIPAEMTFQTKNEMAKEMVSEMIEGGLFEIQYVGCDASFGSDHTFLDGLPESVRYFASVRENEYIFREMPQVIIPENVSGKGGRFKHPRAVEPPVTVKTILSDESVPWVKRVIADGAKGPVIAEIKCLRCVSCRKENRLFMPKSEIWVYIRKHEDGTIKYFVSNLPCGANLAELDRLATARWSIEQCFQECKSHLGMAHYESRSYQAWHRHMLLVMIAQLFVTVLRHFFQKSRDPYDANDPIHHRFTDPNPNNTGVGFYDCSLSLAS